MIQPKQSARSGQKGLRIFCSCAKVIVRGGSVQLTVSYFSSMKVAIPRTIPRISNSIIVALAEKRKVMSFFII